MDKTCLTVVRMSDTPKTPGAALRLKQGTLIRQYRTFRKLSQTDLASRVGVTKAAVSEWERGKSSPRATIQIEIARAVEAPWNVLFGLDSEVA